MRGETEQFIVTWWIALVFVWVVKIDIISVGAIQIDMILVWGSQGAIQIDMILVWGSQVPWL